jgi:hypothetical protein
MEGFMFLLTSVFVACTGYTFTKLWFMRLDDFSVGVPGSVAPTSALLVELRQRQLIAVLLRGRPTTADQPTSSLIEQQGPQGMAGQLSGVEPNLPGGLTAKDFSVIDDMYERAMAGPLCGPLLRLFLAQYIR